MSKKILLTVGFLLTGAGIFGIYNAINSFDVAAVKKVDVPTKGIVTKVYADILKHRITGLTVNTHYKFDYSFVAADGKTYHNTKTLTEVEAKAVEEGQSIDILYHSDIPSINGAVRYGHYTPVAAIPDSSPGFRLAFSSLFAAFGFGIFLIGVKLGGGSTPRAPETCDPLNRSETDYITQRAFHYSS